MMENFQYHWIIDDFYVLLTKPDVGMGQNDHPERWMVWDYRKITKYISMFNPTDIIHYQPLNDPQNIPIPSSYDRSLLILSRF